jgi:hypothetical protein
VENCKDYNGIARSTTRCSWDASLAASFGTADFPVDKYVAISPSEDRIPGGGCLIFECINS